MRRCLLVLLLGACAWPAGASGYALGISDQKIGMWQDPRFAQLGLEHVRLLMAYDAVLAKDFSRYDAWMTAARARGADVLLTIDRSPRSTRRLPTRAQYRRVVRTLRARYPWVKSMAPWNEANHVKQPTYRKPRAAARFYSIMRQECRGCRVIAADVLDSSNLLPWVARFKRFAPRARLWGLHSYTDANRFRPLRATIARRLLAAVRGRIWMTETGGIVRFRPRYRGGRAGEARAARAMRRTFAIAKLSPRIERVYLYHWDADPRFVTWDSAFVAADGRARPALYALRRELNRLRPVPQVPPLALYPDRTLPLVPAP